MKFNRNIITFCLALNIIVALSSGVAITTEGPEVNQVEGDPELEAYLREAIENFREQMRDGIDAIHMPVLDPLVLKHLDINVNEDAATVDLRIHEIVVRDLSQFTLPDLKPDLENFFLQLNLILPAVRANGQYRVNGKIVKIFPIYGEGDFQINITKANIAGQGKLEFIGDTLQMTTLSLDLEWEELAINMENFLGGSNFSQVLQKLVPSIGKGVFEHFRPKVMQLINKALKNEINKQLMKPEVKDIIKGLIPDGN